MSEADNNVHTHRIDKLEGHVDNIYVEVSNLKESGARVEANQKSMGSDIKYLVQQGNRPEAPAKTTQWITIAISIALALASLAYAVMTPMNSRTLANQTNHNIFVADHTDKALIGAYTQGKADQKLDGLMLIFTTLSRDLYKASDKIEELQKRMEKVVTGQLASGQYLRDVGKVQERVILDQLNATREN